MERESHRNSQMGISLEKVRASLLNSSGKKAPPGSELSLLPKAAVAMILHPDEITHEVSLLLIKRVTRERDPWSGQMAFPGGRYAETDKNLLGTVIREVIEEVGVDLRKLSILGALDEVLAGGKPITVTPFVVLAEEEFKISKNPKEIDEFVWIPVSFFSDRRNLQAYKIKRMGQNIEVPSYKFQGDQVIWGMTLRIIEDFLQKLSA